MRRNVIISLAAVAMFGIGCSTNQPVSMQGATGTIQAAAGSLRLTMSNGDDAAALGKKIDPDLTRQGDEVEHVWITIKEVQLHIASDPSENGWKTVATPNKKFDFLELVNGLTAPLDLYALPPAHYTQIRLILGRDSVDNSGLILPANSIVINGETFPITIPSACHTGIKCVRSIFIKENEETEICLAFKVFNTIHYSPGKGYIMRPAYRTFKCDGSDTVTESDPTDPTDPDDPTDPIDPTDPEENY
jgi:hypothetical protein